jgi:hypothetical protein
MKLAVMRYICNGYTIRLTGDPALPEPSSQLIFAATVAESIYWLSQFFEGTAVGSVPNTYPFPAPSLRSLKAIDPLMNQEVQIFETDTPVPGYVVRQMPLTTVPNRPMLDEWCPNMDAVALELDEIYSDGSILPPQPQGLFSFVLIVQPNGISASIQVTRGPAAVVEIYRVIIGTVDGMNTYDVQTQTGWTTDDLASAINAEVNGDGAGFCYASSSGSTLQLVTRDEPNTIVSLQAGVFNGAPQRARVPRSIEPPPVE